MTLLSPQNILESPCYNLPELDLSEQDRDTLCVIPISRKKFSDDASEYEIQYAIDQFTDCLRKFILKRDKDATVSCYYGKGAPYVYLLIPKKSVIDYFSSLDSSVDFKNLSETEEKIFLTHYEQNVSGKKGGSLRNRIQNALTKLNKVNQKNINTNDHNENNNNKNNITASSNQDIQETHHIRKKLKTKIKQENDNNNANLLEHHAALVQTLQALEIRMRQDGVVPHMGYYTIQFPTTTVESSNNFLSNSAVSFQNDFTSNVSHFTQSQNNMSDNVSTHPFTDNNYYSQNGEATHSNGQIFSNETSFHGFDQHPIVKTEQEIQTAKETTNKNQNNDYEFTNMKANAENVIHHETSANSSTSKRRIKFRFININMGASEFAIAKKVVDKLRASYSNEYEIEYDFEMYYGENSWTAYSENRSKPKYYDSNSNLWYTEGYLRRMQADVKLLKIFKCQPKKLNELKDSSNSTNALDINYFELKILLAQTTACGLYSRQTVNHTNKHPNQEAEYQADFRFALKQVQPDIVLLENVNTVPAEFEKKIRSMLNDNGILFTDHKIINHDVCTGISMSRAYTVGIRDINLHFDISNFIPRKQRSAGKYLFHIKDIEKYSQIKKIEDNHKKHKKVRNDFEITNLINQLKIFFSYQANKSNMDKYNIILLPQKTTRIFTADKSGRFTKSSYGLVAKFNKQHGKIAFHDIKNHVEDRIHFDWSHYKFNNLIKDSALIGFWDHGGYIPSLGERALMKGMSKHFTEKLVSGQNKLTRSARNDALLEALSTRIVSYILIGCICTRVGLNLNYHQNPIEREQVPFSHLVEGIDSNEYEICSILDNPNLLTLKKGNDYLEPDIIFTTYSLAELHNIPGLIPKEFVYSGSQKVDDRNENNNNNNNHMSIG